MESKSKIIATEEEFWALVPLFKKFPEIHIKLTEDFELLLNLTEQHKSDAGSFRTLCRACLRTLFSVIEADIVCFNCFDKYEGYKNGHSFQVKFPKTFEQICKTWDWETLQKEYFQAHLEDLIRLKTIRNNLIHPKEVEHILEPSFSTFEEIKNAFINYNKFMLTIMSNFFLTLESSKEKTTNA